MKAELRQHVKASPLSFRKYNNFFSNGMMNTRYEIRHWVMNMCGFFASDSNFQDGF